MRPYIFGGSALLAVLLVVAFGYADQTRLHWVAEAPPTEPLASPDRVVGIEWRCTVRSGGTSDEMRGTGICLAADGGDDFRAYPGDKVQLWNRRQELSIRTSQGTSYTVNVSPRTKVALGDEWPPK